MPPVTRACARGALPYLTDPSHTPTHTRHIRTHTHTHARARQISMPHLPVPPDARSRLFEHFTFKIF